MGLKGSGRRCGQNFGNGRVNKTDLGLAPLVALGSLVKCPVLGCACIDLLGSAPCLPKPQAGPVQDYVLKGNANHLEAASCLEAVKIDSKMFMSERIIIFKVSSRAHLIRSFHSSTKLRK